MVPELAAPHAACNRRPLRWAQAEGFRFRWPPTHEEAPKQGEKVWSAGSAAASQPTTGMNPVSLLAPGSAPLTRDITHDDTIVPSWRVVISRGRLGIELPSRSARRRAP